MGYIAFQVVMLLVVVAIAVGGWFLWDKRYRGSEGGAFQPTQEVFRDPTTGNLTRVWEDPATGRRQYREEKPPA